MTLFQTIILTRTLAYQPVMSHGAMKLKYTILGCQSTHVIHASASSVM